MEVGADSLGVIGLCRSLVLETVLSYEHDEL